ncbi:PH domain-containing protein [Haloterrigena alkaliphila]|uniref:PH domain-containing protein n=1 Tax=Haloterrigena alkaliphila TaxID=2816475 RepID=A0A8A2VDT2_9EURY|nr:PH domain-containing protein [Haloterrigena alkaliphila]QSW98837.1 PH domain-containing protein [Haloterrigena alkaliphila]
MNRLHPLSAVTYALQYGFFWLWIPMAAVVILGGLFDPVSSAWFPVAAPVGFVAGAAYGIAYYYRFEYGVTPDTFDVASGVFARRSREIPYERIQNVDVRQGVLQRVLGLAIVSVETAGGGNTEATLNFVGDAEARRLQDRIRRRTAAVKERRRDRDRDRDRDGADSLSDEGAESSVDGDRSGTSAPRNGSPDAATDRQAPAPESAESTEPTEPRRQRLFELESRELLLYSFTSLRPAAVAGVMFVFFLATDTIIETLVAVAQPFGGPAALGEGSASSYGILTLVSVINGIVVTYVLSVAYTFGTYYAFRLGRVDTDFVYERGLLQRYSGSIPTDKVQSVTVTDNPLQRLIGYAGLWVETAGYGPESNSGSQSAVPLAKEGRVHRFTENLTGVETPKFRSPPTLARRRYLVRYSLLAAVVVAVAFGITRITVLERWYLAGIVFAAVPPAAHLKYANLGYFVAEDHLVIRRGFWQRRTTVIPYYRIQTVSTRRSIFQRRLGLASLSVDTASSQTLFWETPTIYDVHLADARDVHETGRDRLQRALRERARDEGAGLSVDFT